MVGVRGAGRWSRISIGARVVLALILSVVGALLAIHLADSKYVRVDLSKGARNTLDEPLRELIDKLPEPVTIDVFFRPLERPFDAVTLEAQQRCLELLQVARLARREQIELRLHSPKDFESVKARQAELEVEGWNQIVTTCGNRKTVQHLFGEIAVVDWGRPSVPAARYLAELGLSFNYRNLARTPREVIPPRLADFRGGEALAEALLKVASGEFPKVYFSSGQGEPSLEDSLEENVLALAAALRRDGFEVLSWNPSETPELPADADVLVVAGVRQPFPGDTLERLVDWVREGGKLLAAPGLEEVELQSTGGVVELLSRFQMAVVPGVICEPVDVNTGGQSDGYVECSTVQVAEGGMQPSHALTRSLLQRGQRVEFSLAPGFDPIQISVEGSAPLALLSSTSKSWRDLPLERGGYDFAYDRTREEGGRRFPLCMVKEERARSSDGDGDGAVRRGRILGLGTAGFLTGERNVNVNRDFLLGAFNWLAERDYRVGVSHRDPAQSFLDLSRGRALPVLTWSLWLGLPAICVAVGVFLAVRRRSGS